MRVECRLLAIFAGSCLLAAAALAESVPSAASKTAGEEEGFTLTESYGRQRQYRWVYHRYHRRWATFSVHTSR
jgi:hypothetical protein